MVTLARGWQASAVRMTAMSSAVLMLGESAPSVPMAPCICDAVMEVGGVEVARGGDAGAGGLMAQRAQLGWRWHATDWVLPGTPAQGIPDLL